MSKTLPAPRTRAPTTACGTGVPAAAKERSAAASAETPSEPRAIGAPRQAVPRRRVSSNLGEPAGIFVWERDFILSVAADVLNELVNEKEQDEGED
jgi:hypothetical protein